MNPAEHIEKSGGKNFRFILFLLAPVLAGLVMLYADLKPENKQVTYMLGITILIALWWVTEIIPLAITSLYRLYFFRFSESWMAKRFQPSISTMSSSFLWEDF
ncbi:MAG: hypothetical protein IPO32_01460 [Crocinitomicaceae bacterium]|nr:hypothetical protein [Crocinitomicaceae bacterium]